jgi:tetratricopeptide (TPR) repeat protein
MNRTSGILLVTITAVVLAAAPGIAVTAQEPAEPGDPVMDDAAAPDPAEELAEQIAEANDRVRQGDYGGAAEILAGLIDDETDDASLLAFYGEVLVASGEAKNAVPVLERAIRADPERLRLHFQIATAHTTLGEVEEALAAYAREVELNEDPEVRYLAHLNRSILLKRQRRWADAAASLEQALLLKPNPPDAYAELTTYYLEAGDLSQATEALERGAEIGFRSARLYFNVGARLYNDRHYEDAEQAFRSALEINGEMAEAERSLAATLSQLGRAAEAREHLSRYLELRPDASDADEVREHLAASGK